MVAVLAGCGDSGDGGGGGTTDTGEASTASSSSSASSSTTDDPTTGGGEAVCSRDEYWTLGERESPRMHPGRTCLACHADQEPDLATRFAVAGTVYPTMHEPDDCFGLDGAQTPTYIEITAADERVVKLPVNAAGNFMYDREELGDLAFPITARAVQGDRERRMYTPQTSGDCNACHTESGANGAPGRIAAP